MPKSHCTPFMLLGWILLLSGCAAKPQPSPVAAPYFGWLQSLRPDSTLTGKVYFWPAPIGDGIKIQVVLTGAETEQSYQVAIHEKGNCADQGLAAQAVFDPPQSFFEFFSAPAGKLGKFKTDGQGSGFFEAFSKNLSFEKGSKNIAGRAILVYETETRRAACAVIPIPAKEKD